MKEKLSKICTVSSGLVTSRKQASLDSSNTKYKMLTLKSFDADGILIPSQLDEFKSSEILLGKHLTQFNDVVIRLSYPYTAIHIGQEYEGIVIPSLFCVIRVLSNNLIPEFLSVYLNSDKMNRYYMKHSIGTTIQVLKTSLLHEIEIEVPPVEMQRKMIELNKLVKKEKKLLEDLLTHKGRYYKAIINSVLEENIK